VRGMIARKGIVVLLIGGAPISYQSIKFFPFDKESEETTYASRP
jgi:hypothetical protein